MGVLCVLECCWEGGRGEVKRGVGGEGACMALDAILERLQTSWSYGEVHFSAEGTNVLKYCACHHSVSEFLLRFCQLHTAHWSLTPQGCFVFLSVLAGSTMLSFRNSWTLGENAGVRKG